MKTRHIGELEVSEIGMGCMGFSQGYGGVPDEDYAIAAIRKAYEFGCTYFDTAENFGKDKFFAGHNEQLVGKAIEPFRKNVILATKFFIDPLELDGTESVCGRVRKHLEASMKNLRTDYIDLYYLYRVHEGVQEVGVSEIMRGFINEGIIRAWGVSQVSKKMLMQANRRAKVSAVQNLYSIVERDCEEEVLPYCMENNISVVPFSPLCNGFLSGKITAETEFEKDDIRRSIPQLSKENIAANQPILDVLAEYAKKKNATSAQISLAWMLHKYPNVVPLSGSRNQERILENLSASEICFTDEEWKGLEAALDACEIYGHRGCVEIATSRPPKRTRKKRKKEEKEEK